MNWAIVIACDDQAIATVYLNFEYSQQFLSWICAHQADKIASFPKLTRIALYVSSGEEIN
jgi:hypothetical protein